MAISERRKQEDEWIREIPGHIGQQRKEEQSMKGSQEGVRERVEARDRGEGKGQGAAYLQG